MIAMDIIEMNIDLFLILEIYSSKVIQDDSLMGLYRLYGACLRNVLGSQVFCPR
jgi:hypothetical protein